MPLLVIPPLATTDAALNATAAALLLVGLALIKQRREQAHKWTMLAAFAVSSVFLGCYLTYHLTNKPVPFGGQGLIRPVYFAILISHIALALTVPPLAIATIYFGLRDRRAKHLRLARWTYPIWLYVSVTGVVVYVLLYHLFPASA
jgi:uncharacterized membrane protein YozB (DUF420 family)